MFTYFVVYIFHYGVVEVDVDGVFGVGVVVGYDVYMVVSYYKLCHPLRTQGCQIITGATATETQLRADCGLSLDIVVAQGVAIFQLSAGEVQPLMLWWD